MVNLLGSSNQVLDTTTSDDSGAYSFTVASSTLVKVQVEARSQKSGTPGWHLRVEDNTSGNALYVLEGSLANSRTTDSTRSLHAASGWTGSGYGDIRAAAPFAILDVAYEMLQQLLDIDTNLVLPVSRFRWSPLNSTASGDLSAGDIGTSFYSQSNMYILGDENSDTDEYDLHVVAHEWAHYLEDKLGERQDSIGGSHGGEDKLDMRLAFSEGFGNAVAGVVLDDPLYLDTWGSQQANAGGFDISSGPFSAANKGWFNESSIQSVLYNFAQTSNGFAATYQVLTDPSYTNADAFLSVFTFAERLQALAPSSFSSFENLYNGQSINSVDAFAVGELNDGATSEALPVYNQLSVDGTPTSVCSTQQNGNTQGSNKLGSWVYLKAAPTEGGSYQLSVEKTSPLARTTDPDFLVQGGGNVVTTGISADVDVETGTMSLIGGRTYVIAVQDWEMHSTSEATCFDVTLTPSS